MFDLNATAERFSLTDSDLSFIRSAVARLPGPWSLVTEAGDEGELYGRLLAPWGDGRDSAFLLEREEEVIILTDNLSESDRCAVTSFGNAALAMSAVRSIVTGHGSQATNVRIA